MNPDTPDEDGSVVYYDADYPSLELGPAAAAEVEALARIGLLGDVSFYLDQALAGGGPVLEIGCGTGRLSIPLARAGHEVWAVDVSAGMLAQLQAKLAEEPEAVRQRVHVVRQDAAALDLAECRPALAILPFNLLMLVPDPAAERRILASVARHLVPGGRLVLDVMNPAVLPQDADPRPSPSRPRRNPRTGNPYVRHAQAAAVDGLGVQLLSGWYDELLPDGGIRTTRFGFAWRMIGRGELDAMLVEAGFMPEEVHGDFAGARFAPTSSRIVVAARPKG